MKTCVVIPTYNESQNIAGIVNGVKRLNLDVLVVDDGSTDNTAEIAGKAGAFVITNSSNSGKGHSIKEGISLALQKGCDSVLTMDGDGQHDPADIPNFLTRAADDNVDMLLGNRMHDVRDMPFLRRATNIFMSFLISKIARQRIPDTQCGFRLIKRRVLESSRLLSECFEIESEMILEAAKNNYRIDSMPIATIYRNEKSWIRPLRDTLRFIGLLLRYI